MIDFTSALYLGMRHPSRATVRWEQFTTGVPAALAEPPGARALATALARLQGCERASLAPSTLHLFWDLFGTRGAATSVIYVDSGLYAVGRWGVERAAARGAHVERFPHHDAGALATLLRRHARTRRRPVVVTDGFCPGCGAHAPVRDYFELAQTYGGRLVMDDTQSIGIFGSADSTAAPQANPPAAPHGDSLAAPFGHPFATPFDNPVAAPFGNSANESYSNPVAASYGNAAAASYGNPVAASYGDAVATPYGSGGGGTLRRFGLGGPSVLCVSSLAKGFGVPVAVLCGGREAVERFERASATRTHCSPPSNAVLAALAHALTVNSARGDALRLRLSQLVRRFRRRLRALGLDSDGGLFPVQTLAGLPEDGAAELHTSLEARGVRALLRRDRCRGGARLSFIVNALHTPEMIDRAARALADAGARGALAPRGGYGRV